MVYYINYDKNSWMVWYKKFNHIYFSIHLQTHYKKQIGLFIILKVAKKALPWQLIYIEKFSEHRKKFWILIGWKYVDYNSLGTKLKMASGKRIESFLH